MGPLKGLRVVEFAGLGPAPFAAMLMADMGADVVLLERSTGDNLLGIDYDVLKRGKRSVSADLKTAQGFEVAKQLVSCADVLIEGFRPGVMERLRLGPEAFREANPALVYARMTGWGQDGPLAQSAGHDINYIALSGALSAFGETDGKPIMPANLLGDFGGGALYLAFGIMAAVHEARDSGKGQVVDVAISDCTAHLSTMLHGLLFNGQWQDQRGSNLLDGGAHHYNSYRCADNQWISVAPLEPKFYAEFLSKLGLSDDPRFGSSMDAARWTECKGLLEELFLSKSRSHWCDLLEGTDCCFAPVLGLGEAPQHPHNIERRVFETHDDCVQPAPAPRFSRTPGSVDRPPPTPGQNSEEVLREWREDER